MTPEDKTRRLIAAADKLQRQLGLTGLAIVATDECPDGTSSYSAVAGNRFAALGTARAWLAGCEAYDDAYKAESGRYDAVTHRQRRQERGGDPTTGPDA